MSATKAVFFDRDGTLIEDVGYLSSIEQISVFPAIIPLCQKLQAVGYKLFVVTNQSGIARGFFDESSVIAVNKHLQTLFLEHSIILEKCFYCPHHPTAGSDPFYTKACRCRKPQPGMLLQAAHEYNIELQNSIMIGDKDCDVQAGIAAGCKSFFIQELVKNPKAWLQHIQGLQI